MSDPRRAEVWGKKPEVADRTLNERKYCKLCDYYYSEMFTCPICYGEQRATERTIKLLEDLLDKAENFETRRLLIMGIALIKGEQK